MNFENILSELPGKPAFSTFWLKDDNRLAGSQKRRKVSAPNDAMRVVHSRLQQWLSRHPFLSSIATGGVPKGSPVKNVLRHAGNRYFYVLDAKKAYSAVDFDRLLDILLWRDSAVDERAMASFLRSHCFCEEEGLITGAPRSPDLFNLYAGRVLDLPLLEWSQPRGVTATRYIDDVILSHPDRRFGDKRRRAIRNMFDDAGMPLNYRKCYVYDLAKGPVVLNGIGLRCDGSLFLPRHYHRRLEALLWRAIYQGDISPNVVHSTAELFWALTLRWRYEPTWWASYRKVKQLPSRFGMNNTELHLAERYRYYCKLLKSC